MSSTRHIMRRFKIDEISAVRLPAQKGATKKIMKRADGTTKKYFSPRSSGTPGSVLMTNEVEGHQHAIDTVDYDGIKVNGGETSYANDHYHPWITTADGAVIVGAANGHTHSIAIISKTSEGDSTMEKTEEQKRIGELEAQVAKYEKMNALTKEERAFYDALDGDKTKDDFLGKTSVKRKADIAKAVADKEVVYTSADGTTYTKSDDARLVALAKSRDEDRRELELSKARVAEAEVQKRAEGFANLPGKVEDVAAVIKALDRIEDAEQRDRCFEILKAQNATLSGAFKTLGQAGASDDDSADSKLHKMAEAYGNEKEVSLAKAYSEVLKTDEGARLYSQSLTDKGVN